MSLERGQHGDAGSPAGRDLYELLNPAGAPRSEVSPPGASAPSKALSTEPARPSPELPYPEAPLASRKADLPEREGGEGYPTTVQASRSESSAEHSTRAENQAEALAVEEHQERKHGV